ncbi:MAG: FAD-binding protein, partial [Burkholderiales bacterium]|nr:FAD-binding protein [Burkholderiales bacterium]
NELGCFFDRNPDGTIHQKAFAGQTFDRTVHKGDLTGIEIINRLSEQVWVAGVERLEEHRAVELVKAASGAIAGVLMIDMREGDFVFVQARAVLLATGGGPTMYRYHTPSGDKSCDGLAMALRAGLTLRDMEMVQFHPTGLLAGTGTRMTGTVLEEGLRGAGGYLLDGSRERFMAKYDARGERATRDVVSRAIYAEMRAGRSTPNGGVYLAMSHLGPDSVRSQFKGMVDRCGDCGFDLAGGLVEVVPTAHYMMGGVEFAGDGRTAIEGLFAAGEDTGGVHGANRLGGNGVANSTVFGAIAGDTMAAWMRDAVWREPLGYAIEVARANAVRPVGQPAGDIESIREALYQVMWDDVGILRDAAGLSRARARLLELRESLGRTGVSGTDLRYNLTWHDWLNLESLITVSLAICRAAEARTDSCGAHYREDFPESGDLATSSFSCVALNAGTSELDIAWKPVRFTRVQPGQSLLAAA